MKYLCELIPLDAAFLVDIGEIRTIRWKDGFACTDVGNSPTEAFPSNGTINGKQIMHGLWAHPTVDPVYPMSMVGPTSMMTYRLNKKYKTLSGMAGIADSAGKFIDSYINFYILCDKALVWKPDFWLTKPGETRTYSIIVENCELLELYAIVFGKGGRSHPACASCQAMWIDPVLDKDE